MVITTVFEEADIRRGKKRKGIRTILHGKKGFVTLTKSFVKNRENTFFFTTTKFLGLSTKRLVAVAKFLVAATKNLSVVPNFVAET